MCIIAIFIYKNAFVNLLNHGELIMHNLPWCNNFSNEILNQRKHNYLYFTN